MIAHCTVSGTSTDCRPAGAPPRDEVEAWCISLGETVYARFVRIQLRTKSARSCMTIDEGEYELPRNLQAFFDGLGRAER